jgi:hypothetical protein
VTFFHSPEWAAVWSEYTEGRYVAAPRWIRFADGAQAVIAASLERRTARLDRLHLSPQGTYGGWVSAQALLPAHAAAIEREILEQPSIVWRRPPAGVTDGAPQAIEQATQIIDLRDGAERARARWKPQARRYIGRARRAGAVVRPATTLSDWLAYADVYRITSTYWARPTSSYGPELFRLLHDLQSDAARLWVAEISGETVGGVLVMTSRQRAVAWSTAMVRGRAPGLTNLLYWELMKALERDGFAELDLSPSGGHEGVARFKAALGATFVPAPMTVHRHWTDRALGAARRALSRASS